MMFPNLVGEPMLKYDSSTSGITNVKDYEIGWDAHNKRSALKVRHPISNGVITSWDDMERVWDYTFKQANIDTTMSRVVQTEAALNPPKNREKMLEIMFSKFGFQAVNISVQAILALNSQGLKTGFVVDAGDGVTHLVPVTDGYVEPSLVRRMDLAGRHTTDHLMKLLISNGHPLSYTGDMETVAEIKAKFCYVAHDLKAEQKLVRETTLVDTTYTLPDSRQLKISSERFMGPEVLFTPALAGFNDQDGMADMVFNTVRKSALDLQQGYFKHIVLSGGTTMFPGFSSRLERDINKLILEKILNGDKDRLRKFRCHVEDPPRRQHMVFLGASILAEAYGALPQTPWFVTKKEFEEVGPSCVHRLIVTKLS